MIPVVRVKCAQGEFKAFCMRMAGANGSVAPGRAHLREKSPMSTDYDSPWKEALDLYFEAFLALLFPEVHAQIDWSRGYESLDKEFQQVVREAEVGRRYVDKLVKVWTKDGVECWVLIHIEVQTAREAEFPAAHVRLQLPRLRPVQ